MDNRSQIPNFLLLALLVLIGFAARIFFAGEPLWIDELHTAWAVDNSFADVVSRSAQGNQTPLYFLTQWLVCLFTDLSEPALRSTSIATSTIAVLIAGFLVWQWTDNLVAAALTTLLAAGDYWLMFFGSEARPYAMLQLLCVIQTHYLLASIGNEKIASSKLLSAIDWRIVAVTAILPFVHLTSILLIASQAVFMVVFRPNNALKTFLSITVASLLSLLAYPIIESVLFNRGDWKLFAKSSELINDLVTTLLPCVAVPLLLMGLAQMFKRDENNEDDSATGMPNHAQPHQVRFHSLMLIAASCLLPIGFAILLTLTNIAPVASTRYVACSLILAPVFAGFVFARIETNGQPIACLLILLAAVWFHPIANKVWNEEPFAYRSENWNSVVQRISDNRVGNRPLIFLFANLVEDHRILHQDRDPNFDEYLSFPLTGIYDLPEQSNIVPMPTLKKQRWQQQHIQQIVANGGAQIVARTDDSTLKQILSELAILADEQQAKFEVGTETQTGNVVQIVNILPQRQQ